MRVIVGPNFLLLDYCLSLLYLCMVGQRRMVKTEKMCKLTGLCYSHAC